MRSFQKKGNSNNSEQDIQPLIKRSDDAVDKRKEMAKKITQAEVQLKEAQAESLKQQQHKTTALKAKEQALASSQAAVYK